MLPAVVLAGGLGTRVASITGPALPKVMLPVGGRPFIDYKLAGLAAEGVHDVLLLVGHGHEVIRAHVGDGSKLGLRVRYSVEPPGLLGTGGALRAALGQLSDAFFVTYGDSYLPISLAAVEATFEGTGAAGVMTVKRNADAGGPSNVDVTDGWVTAYDRRPRPGSHEYIDFGLLVLTGGAVAAVTARGEERFDLADVFDPLIADRSLAAHQVTADFYEVGTPERYASTVDHLLGRDVWPTLRPPRAAQEAR